MNCTVGCGWAILLPEGRQADRVWGGSEVIGGIFGARELAGQGFGSEFGWRV